MKAIIDKLFPRGTFSRKLIMAVTGLMLIGFLITHLAGNFLIFFSPSAYNRYSHELIHHPLIWIAEAVLLLLFVYHAVDAVILRITERRARPDAYAVDASMGKRTIFSRTMLWTGIIIVIFLVIHIKTFKFGSYYEVAGQPGVRDMFRTVAEELTKPWYAGLYIVVMGLLGFHLAHAFQASLRTVGFSHRLYLQAARVFSYLLAIFLAVGFASIPLYFLFLHKATQGTP